MKTLLVASLAVLVASAAFWFSTRAGRTARREAFHGPPLWSQMQVAVLETQDVKKAEAILHSGFDVNSPIGCGTYSATDGAVQKGNVEMLGMLLRAGAKPRERDLINSAFYQEPEVAFVMTRLLLQAGADVNSRGTYRETALANACYRGNSKVVGLLLEQPDIDLNAADGSGDTPLMEAVRAGHAAIARLLIEKGANARLVNDRGETAATIAAAMPGGRQDIRALVPAIPAMASGSAPTITAAH
jgi:hypothetical protein